MLDKLDLRSEGMELLSVRERSEPLVAAVLVADDKLAAFERKFEAYHRGNRSRSIPNNRHA